MRAQNLQKFRDQAPTAGALDAVRSAARVNVEPTETTERQADKSQASMIGAGIIVTGNIAASNDLHIEGQVIGDVRCATLILTEGSYVNGRVFASRAKVAGVVEGGMETKDLAVEASGRLNGQITYQRLRVANGAVIEGKIAQKGGE